jgi:hypothetical protein
MRLECGRLSDKGLTVPQIAALATLSKVHQAMVREVLHRFATAQLVEADGRARDRHRP